MNTRDIDLPSIIVIDDNPDDIFFIRRAIITAGAKHPIIAFDNADTAFDHLRPEMAVHLIFCDIRMPGASGFDFLKRVRQNAAFDGVRVLMVSSSDLDLDVAKAAKLGADGYLIKYPPPASLAKIINHGPSSEPFDEPKWRPFLR